MSDYQAPLPAIRFALDAIVGSDRLATSGAFPDFDVDMRDTVLDEAAKLAAGVIAPLNRAGDTQPARLENGVVRTSPGFAEAYRAFAEGGWAGIFADQAYGGQGMPHTLSLAVEELWQAANLAFGLCPLLTHGAIEALQAHGSDELKRIYLPKLTSGAWTGTMNLTEPAAGSDVGALKARAVKADDGSYRVTGQKIFITWGEHDCAENIVHLVLARLPDAPPGTRGISLFLVPKILVNKDGSLGARNDVICAGVEHKLGIHASPTCVMKYGEKGEGAIGYLVGEENRGLNVMFIMMNAARLGVGVQGVSIAERATQHALAYARERRQGRSAGTRGTDMAPIIEHADIRRTLMTMQALTQAARAICLATAAAIDVANRGKTAPERATAQARAALLTPLAKAFSTDIAVEVASMGLQVHGGMGFIEETGAAQFYRDARILPIYEGTNGIQSIDLATRKLPLEGGKVMAAYIAELEQTAAAVRASNQPAFGRTAERLAEANAALKQASLWMGAALQSDPEAALAGATPYLRLASLAAGGAYLARAALAAGKHGNAERAVALARFFAENLATAAPGLATTITAGADTVIAMTAQKL